MYIPQSSYTHLNLVVAVVEQDAKFQPLYDSNSDVSQHEHEEIILTLKIFGCGKT
jgi:hypothetical protein